MSDGCDNCYAATFARRVGQDIWDNGRHRFFGDKHWHEPFRWTAGRVFCGSMCDVFEPAAELDGHRDRLWATIEMTPHLTWQLLTKRPEQIPYRVPEVWMRDGFPENVWVGTTVENQATADLRIPRLLKVPARVRFLSCEPLLGPVDLPLPACLDLDRVRTEAERTDGTLDLSGLRWEGGEVADDPPDSPIDWVIVGGESGPAAKRRPFDVDWARMLLSQCRQNEVAYFFKQIGGLRSGIPGPDDVMVREFPS